MKEILKRYITRRRLLECLAIIIGIGFIVGAFSLISPYKIPPEDTLFYSQESSNNFLDRTTYRATVKELRGDSMTVELLDGPRKGRQVDVSLDAMSAADLRIHQAVLVYTLPNSATVTYFDHYRLPVMAAIVGIFAALVLVIGRRQGLMSLLGLLLSIAIVALVIIPAILHGWNAVLATLLGAVLMVVVSMGISHGLRKRTYIAMAIIITIIGLVTLLAYLGQYVLGLSGIGSEVAYYLAVGKSGFSLSDILIASIIIASLGVLDDVVTTQVAAIDELHQENPSISRLTLYTRGMSVGREHIASLINTLALAYLGASLVGILSLTINYQDSLLFILNSELISEEILRTIIASTGLILAVPLSTLLTVYILTRRR